MIQQEPKEERRNSQGLQQLQQEVRRPEQEELITSWTKEEHKLMWDPVQ